MKSIVTLVFIFLIGSTALANTNDNSILLKSQIESYGQNEISKMNFYLNNGILYATTFTEVQEATEKAVARLYKFKNARVKKALAFSTKKNKAKIA